MKLVKLADARPGEKAARDVTDLRGNLMFKAGTALTAESLAACKERNISHLFVETGDPAAPSSPGDVQGRRDALAADVDRMFSGADGTPTMQALREASKRHLLARPAGKG